MSYCFKIILCVINMKLCWDILIQQDFLKQIGDIQDIDSFKHTWKIFDTCAIMILGYEHTLLVHYILNFNIYVNVSPCIISPLVIEKYPHDIGFFNLGNIWPLPLINRSHDGRVVPINNLFDYLFFNLIAQDILFCKKFGITKITIRSAWSPPRPPFV
jgi:hypothetical protein